MSKQYTYIEKYPLHHAANGVRKPEGASLGGQLFGIDFNWRSRGNRPWRTQRNSLDGDEYSEFARDIHLTAADARSFEKVSNLEIIESTQLGLSYLPTKIFTLL